jgi:hypothetical protein
MIKRRRLLIPLGTILLVALALAGWLWVDRGVGVGLRGQAREVLARYDEAVPAAGGTPGRAPTAPPLATDKFLPGTQVESAVTIGGGRRLTVSFTGAAPGSGSCERDYHVEAFESSAAVVVVLEGKPRNILERLHLQSDTELCDAIGHPRTATVTLAQPLRDRAVLDGRSGQPVGVTVSG